MLATIFLDVEQSLQGTPCLVYHVASFLKEVQNRFADDMTILTYIVIYLIQVLHLLSDFGSTNFWDITLENSPATHV